MDDLRRKGKSYFYRYTLWNVRRQVRDRRRATLSEKEPRVSRRRRLLSLFSRCFSVLSLGDQASFFEESARQTSAATAAPTSGPTQKTQTQESASPLSMSAGPSERAGLTLVPVNAIPIR